MSNLPQIFRKSHTSSLRKPEKQGGIFSLQLNSHCKQDQYWSRRASTALTKQSFAKTACKTAASSGRKNYLSARSSLTLNLNDINNFQQEDLKSGSLMKISWQLQQQSQQMRKEIDQFGVQHSIIKQSLNAIEKSFQQQINQIERKCRGYLVDVRSILSQSRRQTWMETKTNKLELEILTVDFRQSRQIVEQSQELLACLFKQVTGQTENDTEK